VGVRDRGGDLRVVNWIDSKAMLGCDFGLADNVVAQAQGYVHRFGPGMVLFWFGCSPRLADIPGVVFVDHFPRVVTVGAAAGRAALDVATADFCDASVWCRDGASPVVL
jgi:hypothetical protein